MRRVMLTVPPAPGMSPSDSSGSDSRVLAAAITCPAKAGSSIPATA